MTWESIIVIIATVISVISAPFMYIWKSVMQRIEHLETELNNKVSETYVRVLLADKLEPLKEDVQALDRKMDFLIDHLLKKE